MSLENLLKVGQLKEHAADAPEIERLLAAARRSLADAHVAAISPELITEARVWMKRHRLHFNIR